MNVYQKALFDAFVWPQAVEEQVRDLLIECNDMGLINLNEQECKKIKKDTFGALIERLKPDVNPNLYERLDKLKDARNDVVHRSSYVKNILAWSAESKLCEQEYNEEIERFKELKACAGKLFGELLDFKKGLFEKQNSI